MFKLSGNEESESARRWVEFEGGELLIAYSGNMQFQRKFNDMQLPHRKKIAKGTLDPKIQRSILCESIAAHVLVGWRKIGDAEGNLIEYSPETATAALISNPDLREFVQDYSMEFTNFRSETVEDMGKT